jgi:hypothetical protein
MRTAKARWFISPLNRKKTGAAAGERILGLGVTDQPASVATRLRFSAKRNLTKQGYYACVMSETGKITQETKMKNRGSHGSRLNQRKV